jgi:hypothetical protein
VFATLSIVVLLCSTGVWARRVAAQGSVTIGGASPSQLVVTAVTANPGLEKSITQQLPLAGAQFVLAFFANIEKSNPQGNDLDTTLVLTNTTDASLSLSITLRDLDGKILATSNPTLSARETRVIAVSDLLP